MVAHLLPKQRVAGSSPVSRSNNLYKGTRPMVSSFCISSSPIRNALIVLRDSGATESGARTGQTIQEP